MSEFINNHPHLKKLALFQKPLMIKNLKITDFCANYSDNKITTEFEFVKKLTNATIFNNNQRSDILSTVNANQMVTIFRIFMSILTIAAIIALIWIKS